MKPDRNTKVVFGIADSVIAGVKTVIFGIPKGAYDSMKDGVTQTFDLTKVGIPVQAVMFGAPTHDEAMALMSGNRPGYTDRRDEDFAIPELSQGEMDVLRERRRQVSEEGYNPAHDDIINSKGELGDAAADYAATADMHEHWYMKSCRPWPWQGQSKRGDRRQDVVKAAALALAEIERLDRLAAKEGGVE